MNEEKIARICWNTNLWQKPSGPSGKSRNKKAYEYITGYGHEEWLLDTEKIIDGYHYSYLQAIGAHRDKYIGKNFNISLYSIDNETKERWWIGQIKNVNITTEEESKKIHRIYKQNKWLKEMETQLTDIGADIDDFKKIPPEAFATIKYKPSNLHLLDEPRQFSAKDPAVTSNYYNLKNKVTTPKFLSNEFKFTSGHNKGKESSTRSYAKSEREGDLFHNRMQTVIFKQLCAEFGKTNVGTEQDTGFGSRIDIVVDEGKKDKPQYVFYELKTSNSIRQCIREGLSQLLEYSYFPNKILARKLVIISQNKLNKDTNSYLVLLREKFKIPIYYRQFNTESSTLEETE